jgi:hypothetical protein
MNTNLREKVIRQLRSASAKSDMLIERHLGNPTGAEGCRPYTTNVEAAMSLLPPGIHFLCGRFEDGDLFWCDVGFRPQVQAWGETMAAAIAGASFAYLTHPELGQAGSPRKVAPDG